LVILKERREILTSCKVLLYRFLRFYLPTFDPPFLKVRGGSVDEGESRAAREWCEAVGEGFDAEWNISDNLTSFCESTSQHSTSWPRSGKKPVILSEVEGPHTFVVRGAAAAVGHRAAKYEV
jgi:hypothetical protein